jgi:hypothetical protein
MTACLPKGSKVFELLEGGAAMRKAGRKKLNVFATAGVDRFAENVDRLSIVLIDLR